MGKWKEIKMQVKRTQHCLFCSQEVSETNTDSYMDHLIDIHKLEKHINKTVQETFKDDTNDDLMSMMSMKNLMETLDKIDLEDVKIGQDFDEEMKIVSVEGNATNVEESKDAAKKHK